MDDRLVQKKLEVLKQLAIAERRDITGWRVRTAKYTAPGDYQDLSEWSDLSGRSHFAGGETVFVEGRVSLPDGWSRETAYLDFAIQEMEGLLRVDGEPYAGVDANHTRIPFPRQSNFAATLEFNAVPGLPRLTAEERRLREARLIGARLVLVAPALEALWFDLDLLWQTARLVKDDWLARNLDEVLEEHLLRIDLTRPVSELEGQTGALRDSIAAALDPLRSKRQGPRIFLTGHSHIDVAWLWPLAETVRKCSRTFSTACRLLERYPDYHFSCSQPQLYAYTREHYPTLYEEIKKWVATGRWQTSGGMWIESDCNVPGGESLIRQFLHGMKLFAEDFGTRPSTCWLPDVFGFSGNLPQIIQGCGHNAFFTTKIHWQRRTAFEHNLFWWEGIDGSRVLAHTPVLDRNYNNQLTPQELLNAASNYQQKTAHDELLFPFGHGDGGGGPTPEMLEYASRLGNHPGLPRTVSGTEEAYFARVREAEPALPTWRGELYLETHRGTLTSQAFIKRYTRRLENLFRSVEILSVQRALAGSTGTGEQHGEIDDLWRLFLLQHFHDILPGSSITAVYQDARRDCARIDGDLSRILGASLEALSEGQAGVHLYNTLSWDHTGVVETRLDGLDPGRRYRMRNAETGTLTSLQPVCPEAQSWVFVPRDVPALGKSVYIVEEETAAEPSESTPSVSATHMENRFFLIDLNERGEIVRLLDRRLDREVVPPGSPANRIGFFQDGPAREDAWNIYAEHQRRPYEDASPTEITVRETGPVRGILRWERKYRESLFTQDIIIYADIPRIDFATVVEWKERQTLVKAEFPLLIRSDSACFEIPFGAVRRPTHRNTPWDQEMFEVPAQRWADLSEAGYGVSLLNDSKYGYSVRDNGLSMTLLRGTENPDPVADLGTHRFLYSLYPHRGDWAVGQTVRRGWELNSPLIPWVAVKKEGSRPIIHRVSVDGPAVLSCLKPAADGSQSVIVRFYEAEGGRGQVTVRPSWPLSGVAATNLIEEDEHAVPFDDGAFRFSITPFAIRTFRLVPGCSRDG